MGVLLHNPQEFSASSAVCHWAGFLTSLILCEFILKTMSNTVLSLAWDQMREYQKCVWGTLPVVTSALSLCPALCLPLVLYPNAMRPVTLGPENLMTI